MFTGTAILAITLAAVCDSVESASWTLEKCLARGLEEGLELQKGNVAVKAAREEKNLTFLDFLPELNFYTTEDFNWGRSVDMQELVIVNDKASSASSVSASASLSSGTLINAGLDCHRRRLAVDRAVAQRDGIRENLAIEITEAYLEMLLSYRMYDIAKANYDNILVQKNRVEKEVEAGKVPYGSLFEIEAQAASEREALTEAEGRSRKALIALSGYLNLSPGEKLSVSPPADGSIPSPDILPGISDIPRIIHGNPRMKSAEAALKISSTSRASALLDLLPDFSVTGAYSTGYSSMASGNAGEQYRNNLNPAINLTISVPILSGSGNILKYRNSGREAATLAMDREKCRRDLYCEMEKALTEAVNSYEICLAAEENKVAMEKSFRTNEARFEAGMISGSEYLICRNNFQKAVALYWQARYKYLFQLKVIDFRMGLKPGMEGKSFKL